MEEYRQLEERVRMDDLHVTRPHARSRLLDAMNGTGMAYEAFRAKPHERLFRLSAE